MVLVTGAGGQVGRSVVEVLAKDPRWKTIRYLDVVKTWNPPSHVEIIVITLSFAFICSLVEKAPREFR